MNAYAILLCVALACNIGEPRMLVLASVVGIGVFAPIPPIHFYAWCALGEACIAAIAYLLNTRASRTICRVSLLLLVFHILGAVLGGYQASSPYHDLVTVAEHAELIACIILSRPLKIKAKKWKL